MDEEELGGVVEVFNFILSTILSVILLVVFRMMLSMPHVCVGQRTARVGCGGSCQVSSILEYPSLEHGTCQSTKK